MQGAKRVQVARNGRAGDHRTQALHGEGQAEAERSTIRLSDNDPAYLPEGSTGAFGNARRSKVRIGPATWTQALQQVLGLPPNWRAHSYCILLDAGEDSEHPH